MAASVRAMLAEAKWRGLWGTVRAVKMNKFGTQQFFVAEDEQGNKFFENKGDSFGRDRWVEYSDSKNFDSSNISPRCVVCVPAHSPDL
jgi:NADH ubiquinone oxidoreductase subunit NDUFA12